MRVPRIHERHRRPARLDNLGLLVLDPRGDFAALPSIRTRKEEAVTDPEGPREEVEEDAPCSSRPSRRPRAAC